MDDNNDIILSDLKPEYLFRALLMDNLNINEDSGVLKVSKFPCGDGDIDPDLGEECDGTNLNGQSCENLGLGFGDLACTSQCKFNINGCEINSCEAFNNNQESCNACTNNCAKAVKSAEKIGVTNCGEVRLIEGNSQAQNCYDTIECYCAYDDSDNTCGGNWKTVSTRSGCSVIDIPTSGSCSINNVETGDTCEDGFINTKWSAKITWPSNNLGDGDPGDSDYIQFLNSINPGTNNGWDNKWHYDPTWSNGERLMYDNCKDGTKTMPCPATTQLPFFGFWNVIASLGVISLVYVYLILKRKYLL